MFGFGAFEKLLIVMMNDTFEDWISPGYYVGNSLFEPTIIDVGSLTFGGTLNIFHAGIERVIVEILETILYTLFTKAVQSLIGLALVYLQAGIVHTRELLFAPHTAILDNQSIDLFLQEVQRPLCLNLIRKELFLLRELLSNRGAKVVERCLKKLVVNFLGYFFIDLL